MPSVILDGIDAAGSAWGLLANLQGAGKGGTALPQQP
jgi:hypothetical protein